MNAIRCDHCNDIVIPVEGIERECLCGSVHVLGIPTELKLGWIVEVKIWNMVVDDVPVEGDAKVVKINNHYLSGAVGINEFFRGQDDMFTRSNSHIVITDLDTPGVKLVTEWSVQPKRSCRWGTKL